MASRKLAEQLEEQPPSKKPRIDNPEEQREIDANSNEANFPTSEASSRCPLPLELNCEIFKCLKLQIQGKFIWGLGRGIYAMFGQKLIIKTKRLRNPSGNRWFGRNRVDFLISEDGLNISASVSSCNISVTTAHNVLAEHGFPITGEYARMDSFPGTILYYYEVSVVSFLHDVVRLGLSSGTIPYRMPFGQLLNSYAIRAGSTTACLLGGEPHRFQSPEGAVRPQKKKYANVYGCGLVLDPENKLSIFFTLNGRLLGKQIPISPSVALLYPTIRMLEFYSEANFGDDPAKPFEYDIRNCPGLGLPCI